MGCIPLDLFAYIHMLKYERTGIFYNGSINLIGGLTGCM